MFNPLHLTSAASLNQTLLAALPGANLRWVGRPAFEALSLEALTKLADCADRADIYGRRLAHLIATLTGGGNAVASETAWRAAYLRYWAQVDQVWLAGGLAVALESSLLETVRFEVVRLGARDISIELAPRAGVLPLIGAARSRLQPHSHAVVLDFGHTAVKRGIATVTDHQLESLDLQPSLPTQTLDTYGQGAGVVDFVLDVVTDTIEVGQRRFGALDPSILISVASYLSRGLPVDTRSVYGPLREVTLHFLDQELRKRTGIPVHVRFVHDGTMAARGLPNPHRAGLIMLGTALGVGFPPPSKTLLPVGPDFFVQDLAADTAEA